MRVIAGKVKGFPLKASPGSRPTSGKVRGAIFSALSSLGPLPARVLDLYAGSGALGIEALSRGAQRADFVEKDRRSCQLIRHNLGVTELQDKGRVFCGQVGRTLSRLEGPYELVFFDPPYGDPNLPGLLSQLAASPLLTQDSLVVVEASQRQALELAFGRLCLIRELRHGDTRVYIYVLNGSS